ncbi:conserved hypothetical protein [Trichinella spiralis]|nr:conserved hypothetical protein [Trichinella spiralis]
MNAYVTEITLGELVTVQHTALWERGLFHKILLGWDSMRYHGCIPDPTAGYLRMQQGSPTPLHAISPQPELIAHSRVRKAVEKILSGEQEANGKHRTALVAIVREFADVLSTSYEDLRQTSVIRHAIHTGDAKPVRCFPRRIPYHK